MTAYYPRVPRWPATSWKGASPAHTSARYSKCWRRSPPTFRRRRKLPPKHRWPATRTEFTPAEITNLGSRLLAHLDPDGTLPNPKDRKRRRRLWVNRQNAQLMSRLTADLDPIARARLDTVLDSWAKPGMNNPDDPDSPVGPITTANAEQVAAAALRDQRSPAQRNHDAFSALLGQVLESGMLGNTHRGLPIQVIVTTSLHELEAQAGSRKPRPEHCCRSRM